MDADRSDQQEPTMPPSAQSAWICSTNWQHPPKRENLAGLPVARVANILGAAAPRFVDLCAARLCSSAATTSGKAGFTGGSNAKDVAMPECSLPCMNPWLISLDIALFSVYDIC